MTKINHLDGIASQFIQTDGLLMHVLTAGSNDRPPILFLHGNTSSSTIWEEVMLEYSDNFYCVAPDLRGFGNTEEKLIDATQGVQNWLDDLSALIKKMNLEPFHLVGHSLGGFVCWGMIARHAAKISTVSLIAPGPPMGFGGIHGKQGVRNNEDYSGSGGGIVVKEFVNRIQAKDRSKNDFLYSPRNAMNRLFWKKGFKAAREEEILSAMLQICTGDQYYPGDYKHSEYWPGVAPGRFGPVNAISPKYNQNLLTDVLAADPKPPLLWIYGEDDHIIADESYSDPGFQGKKNLRSGWPGEASYPPQPMISQINYALEGYSSNEGTVSITLLEDCGHTPFIEKPKKTLEALSSHIKPARTKFYN